MADSFAPALGERLNESQPGDRLGLDNRLHDGSRQQGWAGLVTRTVTRSPPPSTTSMRSPISVRLTWACLVFIALENKGVPKMMGLTAQALVKIDGKGHLKRSLKRENIEEFSETSFASGAFSPRISASSLRSSFSRPESFVGVMT